MRGRQVLWDLRGTHLPLTTETVGTLVEDTLEGMLTPTVTAYAFARVFGVECARVCLCVNAQVCVLYL